MPIEYLVIGLAVLNFVAVFWRAQKMAGMEDRSNLRLLFIIPAVLAAVCLIALAFLRAPDWRMMAFILGIGFFLPRAFGAMAGAIYGLSKRPR